MDARTFLQEAARMCKAQKGCEKCPITDGNDNCMLYGIPEKWDGEDIDWAIEAVEKWSEGHQRKTILQDFLGKYPNAPLLEGFNIPRCYPVSLGYCDYAGCLYCPNKGKGTVWCWNQEVQNDEFD